MILPDHEIIEWCETGNLVTPFDPALVNPASLDIRLGNSVLLEEGNRREWHEITIDNYTKDNPFWLDPGEFILAQSHEIFNVPDCLAGQFALKSSLARDGFEHLMAGYIDPGFTGSVLTLELKNARHIHHVPIWPGMRIGQIVWHQLSSEPMVSYKDSGRYNFDSRVTQCKGLI